MITRRTAAIALVLGMLVGAIRPISAQTFPPQIQQFWNQLSNGVIAFTTGRVVANGYFNWGTTTGTNGYGIRALNGVMQFKNSAGAWVNIPGAGGNLCPGDGTTYIAQVATNDLGTYTNATNCASGTLRFDVSSAAATFAVPVMGPNGTNGAPAFTFTSDPTTGIYRVSASTFGIALGGAQAIGFSSNAAGGVRLVSSLPVSWSSTGNTFDTADLFLYRIGAGVAQFCGASCTGFTRLILGTNDATTNGVGIVNSSGSFNFTTGDGSSNVGGRFSALGINTTTPSAGAIALAGKVTTLNGVATAGIGVPAIYAAANVTAQAAANASICTYTNGAADGDFEVSGQVNVTAATGIATTLTFTYTDVSNTSRSMIMPIQQVSGTFVAAGAITGTGAWETPVMHIRAKASTAITGLTSTGTFTGVTYSASCAIRQLQ